MLTKDKIIGIFCFIDDLLKTSCHYEDSRRQVSDSEVITTPSGASLKHSVTCALLCRFLQNYCQLIDTKPEKGIASVVKNEPSKANEHMDPRW